VNDFQFFKTDYAGVSKIFFAMPAGPSKLPTQKNLYFIVLHQLGRGVWLLPKVVMVYNL
jgi:hypothetical protein